MNEGLGFHPFSDGMPYAPKPSANPTSASATMNPSSTKLQVTRPASVAVKPALTVHPRTFQTAAATSRPFEPSFKQSSPTNVSPKNSHHSSVGKPLPQRTFPISETEVFSYSRPTNDFGFAYLFQRFFAYLLDTLFNLSIFATGLSLGLLYFSPIDSQGLDLSVVWMAGAFLFGCSWITVLAQEIAFGSSIGKRIFGLKLQGSPFDIFLRGFFFLGSLGFVGLGILMALFDPQRRCWHDVASQIQPEQKT